MSDTDAEGEDVYRAASNLSAEEKARVEESRVWAKTLIQSNEFSTDSRLGRKHAGPVGEPITEESEDRAAEIEAFLQMHGDGESGA